MATFVIHEAQRLGLKIYKYGCTVVRTVIVPLYFLKFEPFLLPLSWISGLWVGSIYAHFFTIMTLVFSLTLLCN